MIIVGIDPGDSWCGFAALDSNKHSVRIESRTYACDGRSIFRMVETLLPFAGTDERIIVVAENFQIRTVGHQRFNAGKTLRLLGALEYVCLRYGWSWNLVPPGDWKKELALVFGNHVLTQYKQEWPEPGNPNWDHCLSAWRVLGRYLLAEQLTSVLAPMRLGRGNAPDYWKPTPAWIVTKTKDRDLVAPAMRHTLTK